MLEVSSINTQCTAIIFIRWLPSTTNFPEAKLSSTFLSPIFWKYSKTLQQQTEIIQRLFRLQICLSRKPSTLFRKYSRLSNQQQQPTAAINSNYQQQQSAASTINSNQQQQQQQPTAAINSSNQQQQSTASASSSIRQQQSTTATTSLRPTSTTSTIHDDPR